MVAQKSRRSAAQAASRYKLAPVVRQLVDKRIRKIEPQVKRALSLPVYTAHGTGASIGAGDIVFLLPEIKFGDSSDDSESNKMKLASLRIDYTLFTDQEYLAWTGRQVRVIILSSRQFPNYVHLNDAGNRAVIANNLSTC